MTPPLVWAVLLSAFAVSLAQPNDWLLVGSPFLALVGWVPLFWALGRAESHRSAALLGALFGLVTTLLQNYWLAFYQDYAFWTIGGVGLGLTIYGALLGPVLRTALSGRKDLRPFLVGAVWAVFEYLKSNGFLGFPWGLAPYPLHHWPWMIQIVDITGLSFLTFLLISWNAWLAEGVGKRGDFRVSTAVFFGLVVIGIGLYGIGKLNEPRPTRGSLTVALIQQNGDPWDSGEDLGPLTVSLRHSREALKEARIDLVVWSETALRHPLQEWRPYYERNPAESPLFRTIRSSKTWWLLGNPYFQEFSFEKGLRDSVVNAAVLMNPQAQIVDYYGKVQQVPFAEAVPFWEVPAVKEFFQTVVGIYGSWDPGRKWTVFEVPTRGSAHTARISTPICFEDAFPWVASRMVKGGAEVLVNLTNDSWSRRDSSQVQHHVAALFRAVENRVWLVRSTNAGVTSVLGPTGEIAAGPLPSFQDGHLVATIPLPQKKTLTAYTEYGDWLILVFTAIVLLTIVSAARRTTP